MSSRNSAVASGARPAGRVLRAWMIGIVMWGGVPVSPNPAAAADQELVVLSHQAEAPAASAFFIRVRVVNRGRSALSGCQVVDGRLLADGHCLFLGYRFWRAPKRMKVASIDPAALLARKEVLAPGEFVERTVRFQTSRRPPRDVEQQVLHVYLVRGPGDALEWTHIAVPLVAGPVPATVRLREWVSVLLLGFYVSALTWAGWRAVRGLKMGEVLGCSR